MQDHIQFERFCLSMPDSYSLAESSSASRLLSAGYDLLYPSFGRNVSQINGFPSHMPRPIEVLF